ncbi:hypothetical protein ABK040_002983 [Willaertia magna]
MLKTNSTSQRTKILSLFLFIFIIFQQISNIYPQACTPNAGSSPNSANYICPIGFINVRDTSKAVTAADAFSCKTVSNMKTTVDDRKVCAIDADCKITSTDDNSDYTDNMNMRCILGRCSYQQTRYLGDSCNADSQCLSGRCDTITNFVCVPNTVKNPAKHMERCNLQDSTSGLQTLCQTGTSDNLQCVNEVINGMNYGFCYRQKIVPLGSSCYSFNNVTKEYSACKSSEGFCDVKTRNCVPKLELGQNCTIHSECKSDDCQYKNTITPDYKVCKELLGYGDECSLTEECSHIYVCRSRSEGGKRACYPPAELNEYCTSSPDCNWNSRWSFGNLGYDQFVRCANTRCVRYNGVADDKPCEADRDCYSGYCEITSQTCKPWSRTCQKSGDNGCNYCYCGTTEAPLTQGVCVNNVCPGYYLDLQICVYNNFVQTLSSSEQNTYMKFVNPNQIGIDRPFLDTDSSLYKLCSTQYTNLYRCLRNGGLSWTTDKLPGYYIDASPSANLLMPKVISAASSNTIVSMIVVIISIVFFLF